MQDGIGGEWRSGGCPAWGVDWLESKLEQLKGSVVVGDLEGVAEVTIGVADTILASSLRPLEGGVF